MKNCIRIPRLFIPRNFEGWAVPPVGGDRALLERLTREVGENLSTIRFQPSAYTEEDGETCIQAIKKEMYRVLEADRIEKLNRGLIFVERKLPAGTRYGIVAALDLEQYSFAHRENAPARPVQECDPAETALFYDLRANTPLEFPHTVILYRDKRNKIVRGLLKEELEELYDFDLPEEGGTVKGSYIPDYVGDMVAEDMHTHGDPCFVVLDGCEAARAAKMYWESRKETLEATEMRNHPARFLLAEFVNVYDPALEVVPVHRLVREVDADALCDFFARNIKCKREGNLIIPAGSGASVMRKCAEVLTVFLVKNGGRVEYLTDAAQLARCAKEEETAGILMPAIDKEDLFSAVKGESLPAASVSLGASNVRRYALEGREISYD